MKVLLINFKSVIKTFIALLCVISAMHLQAENFVHTFNEYWHFNIGDSIVWANPDYDDSHWSDISIRDYWENQGYNDYDGYAWYRQSFSIPPSKEGSIRNAGGLYIHYKYADDVDEVYVNGFQVGRMGEFPPNMKVNYKDARKFRIPVDALHFDKDNLVAIRIYDNGGNGGIKCDKVTLHTISALDDVKLKPEFTQAYWTSTETDRILFSVSLKDSLPQSSSFKLICNITTDDFHPVDSLYYKVDCPAFENFRQEIAFCPPNPGFYRITIHAASGEFFSDPVLFNVGYKPEEIVSPIDAKPDFDAFWQQTLSELDQVDPRFNMTLLEEQSSDLKNVYHVEMYSLGNEKIEGCYATPKKAGKHPAMISFLGYGSGSTPPNPNFMPDYCVLVLSMRGQGIQKATNKYGEWLLSGIESKDTYYYRGAYMDAVRGIDFLCSRPEVDQSNLFAEGGSQGGAFTFAACALNDRIKAAAPYIPFLSDFRDYFDIVPWPKDLFDTYLKNHPEKSWDDIYDILSYFDIKNLAPKITCPIIMGVGLQDNTCPPHINFAIYNQLTSSKQYYIYPEEGHMVGKSWWGMRDRFFWENMKE